MKKYTFLFVGIFLFLIIFFIANNTGMSITEEEMVEKKFREYVTKEGGTEAAFKNAYWDNKEDGIYLDYNTGKPLFSSLDKYDSGTGWPAFTKPIDNDSVKTKTDTTNGMIRTEALTDASHLGHVFKDGPNGGNRFCINSASLTFVPYEELDEKGLSEYKELFPYETIVLAGGCFWGVEYLLQETEGIIYAVSGYANSKIKDPSYEDVLIGKTQAAEAVKVVFNKSKITTEEVLDIFWRLHNPTEVNRQGPDVGTQYRSAIFYSSDKQKEIAQKSRDAFEKKGVFEDPVVTQIVKLENFYVAEDYHQDYVDNNPGYVCHTLRAE